MEMVLICSNNSVVLPASAGPGSTRVSRVVFGVPPNTRRIGRLGRDAQAGTRDACAPRTYEPSERVGVRASAGPTGGCRLTRRRG